MASLYSTIIVLLLYSDWTVDRQLGLSAPPNFPQTSNHRISNSPTSTHAVPNQIQVLRGTLINHPIRRVRDACATPTPNSIPNACRAPAVSAPPASNPPFPRLAIPVPVADFTMAWQSSTPGSGARAATPTVFEQQREELVREIAVVRPIPHNQPPTAYPSRR